MVTNRFIITTNMSSEPKILIIADHHMLKISFSQKAATQIDNFQIVGYISGECGCTFAPSTFQPWIIMWAKSV